VEALKYKGPKVDGVTQSLLSNFIDCPQRCLYDLQGWQIPGTKDAFLFGSLMHKLFELHIVSMKNGTPFPSFSKLRKDWLKNERVQQADRTLIEEHFAKAFPLLKAYCVRWDKDDKKRKWIGAEQIFDVSWKGYRLRGMRDGIYEVKGKIWIIEHKTTSSSVSNATFSSKLNFDFQSLFYALATLVERKIPVAGILYDVVKVPSLVMNEPPSAYAERLTEHIQDNVDSYFGRYMITLDARTWKRFQSQLLLKLHNFDDWIARMNRGGLAMMNEAACVKRWNCQFIPMCAGGGTAGFTQTRRLFEELENRA
jgi:hypothetical protein